MSKYPVLKADEVIKALQKIGFVETRRKGSHIQLKKSNLLVTVPIHNKDLKLETLKSILRQAKLTLDEFLEILN
jgi:predicted RNA binding protein YcfA (HicA-like mRNA interferase family)